MTLDTEKIRAVAREEAEAAAERPASSWRSRLIEDGLAVLGGIIAAAYVVGVEIWPHVKGTASCASHGIPWGVVIVVGACVLPKTVGRASAGRIWERFTPKAA